VAERGDEVFFQLLAARIIEQVSRLDSLRVLEEAGVTPAPYRIVTRRLRGVRPRFLAASACRRRARRPLAWGPPACALRDSD